MRFIRRLVFWFRRHREADDLHDELEFHLRMHEDALKEDGVDGAQVTARRLMGNRVQAREDARAVWIWPWAEQSLQDVFFAARMLVRKPGLAAAVVLTLGLGAGVNGVMFSLVDFLMLRPLDHVREPGRLVHVEDAINYPSLLAMREQSRSLDFAAYTHRTLSLGRGEEAQRVSVEFVTQNYFDLLGAIPLLGRWFVAGEETPLVLSAVAVISEDLWRRRWQGDPSIVGEDVWVSNGLYTIVGVAPADFTGVQVSPVDLWLPISANPVLTNGNLTTASGGWLRAFGRIRAGFTFESAAVESSTLELMMAGGLPVPPPVALLPLNEIRFRNSNVSDQTIVLWLFGAAGVVLLGACANVAGLLFVRSAERKREIAVRGQLGAAPGRILRQLVTECLVLAVPVAVLAGVVVLWAGPLLRTFFVPEVVVADVLDGRVAAITAAFALTAITLSAIFPVFRTLRLVSFNLPRAGRASYAHSRSRQVLLGTQVALAVVLLTLAGLFVRSVERVTQLDFGFEPDRVLMVSADLPRMGYSPAETNAIFDRLLESVQAMPEVERAGLNVSMPVGGGFIGALLPPRDMWDILPPIPNNMPTTHMVTPDYLPALGIDVIAGRGFTPADVDGAQPVVIVPQATAERYWPGGDALGQCLENFERECFTVVGIVENSRQFIDASAGKVDDAVFVTQAQARQQNDFMAVRGLFVRTTDTDQIRSGMVAALHAAEPGLPYLQVQSLWSLLDPQTRSWRLGASVFSLFGGLAVILAGIGIYGVLAFSVQQRTSEIGIRMALGAMRSDVLRLVMRESGLVIILGGLAGVLATRASTTLVEGFLFQTEATDAVSFASSILIVVAVGAVACLIPVLRASRIDPMVALRHE